MHREHAELYLGVATLFDLTAPELHHFAALRHECNLSGWHKSAACIIFYSSRVASTPVPCIFSVYSVSEYTVSILIT